MTAGEKLIKLLEENLEEWRRDAVIPEISRRGVDLPKLKAYLKIIRGIAEKFEKEISAEEEFQQKQRESKKTK